MKEITHLLQSKYRHFNNLLFDDRLELFCKYVSCRNTDNHYLLELAFNENEALDPDNNVLIQRFDYNEFTKFREYVLYMQYSIMKLYNYHESYKRKIIKKFIDQKIILKRRSYMIILSELNILCNDLCFLIVEFLI